MPKLDWMTLEQERVELERRICWFGYEVIEGQDQGTHVVFKVRRRKAVKSR
jgi:hypothetical protein